MTDYIGTSANDVLIGTSANDTFQGMAGADYLFGGGGNDTAIYLDSLAGVYVDLDGGPGAGKFGSAEGDTLAYIENVQGSVFGDVLAGDIHANILKGEGGNDTLKGGGGADTLNGGAGNDTASYVDSSAGVTVNLLSGIASGGDAEDDVFISIENVTGSDHADNLWGGNNVNVLKGDDGNDTLKGFGGADTLWGGANEDELYGGDGEDTMYGGLGSDFLDGGTGADVLSGNGGADVFSFYEASHTTVAAPDKIIDMNENAGDRIRLSHIDANVNVGGDQAFTWIGNDNDFVQSMGAGQLRFNDGYVEGDVDGDMVADFRIEVNAPPLHDYAFIL